MTNIWLIWLKKSAELSNYQIMTKYDTTIDMQYFNLSMFCNTGNRMQSFIFEIPESFQDNWQTQYPYLGLCQQNNMKF